MRGLQESRAARREGIPSRRFFPIPRQRWGRWSLAAAIATPIVAIGALSWWFTAPVESLDGAFTDPGPSLASAASVADSVAGLSWPDGPLEGDSAKEILLSTLRAAESRLEQVSGYTALFIRQELLKGKLGPQYRQQMKLRHQPFAIYLNFLEPEAGKEVIYVEGHFDGNVIAHPGGTLGRFLAPRLGVKPESRIALADNRHPITDAGLLNLTRKLVRYRELDLHDDLAQTSLSRITSPEGKELLRSVHRHTKFHPERPFAWVDVWYDPETYIPVRIESHDWPGQEGPYSDAECPLAELYEYRDLVLDAELNAKDFDPSNPDYRFHRF